MPISPLIRRTIYGSRIFFPLRDAYQMFFDKHTAARRKGMENFYAQFISPGDLVFDIGANDGVYSECFSAIGARVISVEPHPGCRTTLDLLAKNRPVAVVPCVIDAFPGKRTLHISAYSEQSTVTDKWDKESNRVVWTDHVEVAATTIDLLREKYGMPSFIKIDVEGFEAQALRGMSFTPNGFSFEFNRTFPEVARGCLDMPLMGMYEFNFTRAHEMSLSSPIWLSASAMKERVESLAAPEEFGDVIARIRPQLSKE